MRGRGPAEDTKGKHLSDTSQARERTLVRKRRDWGPWGKGKMKYAFLTSVFIPEETEKFKFQSHPQERSIT